MTYRESKNPARVAEYAARDILAQVVGSSGSVSPLPQDNADYLIRYRDGRTAVGEVKVAFDEAEQRLWAILLDQPKHQTLPLPAGSGRWAVQVDPSASVVALRRELPSLVAQLEARGERELIVSYSFEDPVADALALLGVSMVFAGEVSGDDIDECMVFVEGVGGAVPLDANEAATWISDFLASPKHSKSWDRLGRAAAEEKHAFVWIDSAAPASLRLRVSFHPDVPPSEAPTTPPWLTHLWLGIRLSFASSHYVWLYRPAHGWVAHAVS